MEVANTILGYLCNFLKEQSMVNLSNINIDQLVPLLIDMVRIDYYIQIKIFCFSFIRIY